MIYATWLADTLRAAGVDVVEHHGWDERTRPGAFQPRAVMWHHDASAEGPSPNVPEYIATTGTLAAPAPLAQCWVDTAGVWHLLAAGRANHAGVGGPWGVVRTDRGNEDAIGVETDHTTGEAWPPAQLASLRAGTAALLARLGADPRRALLGHKEYAPGRKTDPDGLDMAEERATVAALMSRPQEGDVPLTGQDAKVVWTSPVGNQPGQPGWWQALMARLDAIEAKLDALDQK